MASHPIQQVERSPEELRGRADFNRQKDMGQGSYSSKELKVTLLRGTAGVRRAGYPLVLTGKFQNNELGIHSRETLKQQLG